MNYAPKAPRYAEALASAEARIVAALPEVLDGLIARANGGDVRAAVYLCDRALGRVADAKADPAEGREAEPMRRIVIPCRDTHPGIDVVMPLSAPWGAGHSRGCSKRCGTALAAKPGPDSMPTVAEAGVEHGG